MKLEQKLNRTRDIVLTCIEEETAWMTDAELKDFIHVIIDDLEFKVDVINDKAYRRIMNKET